MPVETHSNSRDGFNSSLYNASSSQAADNDKTTSTIRKVSTSKGKSVAVADTQDAGHTPRILPVESSSIPNLDLNDNDSDPNDWRDGAIIRYRAESARHREERTRHREQIVRQREELASLREQLQRASTMRSDTPLPSTELPIRHGPSSLPRIEKIPLVVTKLTDGNDDSISPANWAHLVRSNLRRYKAYFQDEQHKLDYILECTAGRAAQAINPYVLGTPGFSYKSPDDLVDYAANFVSNPMEREEARQEFNRLFMKSSDDFWEFLHRFRELSVKARITDDRTLMEHLYDRLPARLYTKLAQEWRRARNFDHWIAAIQAEDLCHKSYQLRQPAKPAPAAAVDAPRGRNSQRSADYARQKQASEAHRGSQLQSFPAAGQRQHLRPVNVHEIAEAAPAVAEAAPAPPPDDDPYNDFYPSDPEGDEPGAPPTKDSA